MLTPTPCNKQDSSEQCFAGDFLAEASIRFYPDPIQHYYGTMPPPHPMMHTNVAWSFDTHFVQPEFVHDGLVDPQSIFSSPKTAFNMSLLPMDATTHMFQEGQNERVAVQSETYQVDDDFDETLNEDGDDTCEDEQGTADTTVASEAHLSEGEDADGEFEYDYDYLSAAESAQHSLRFWNEKCPSPTYVAGQSSPKAETTPESDLGALQHPQTPPEQQEHLVTSAKPVQAHTEMSMKIEDEAKDGSEGETAAIILMHLAKTEVDSISEHDHVNYAALNESIAADIREFPSCFPIHDAFPRFYQRYKVPSLLAPEHIQPVFGGHQPDEFFDDIRDVGGRATAKFGTFNPPKSLLDLYTPRYCRGTGCTKEGLCPICYEDGIVRFFKTKISAYNYHMQYCHGISAGTGLPFTPPIAYRKRQRIASPRDKSELLQGQCHVCKKFVDIEGVKLGTVKVPEIYWWKHAQSCHRAAAPMEGLGGWFVKDAFYQRVQNYIDSNKELSRGTS